MTRPARLAAAGLALTLAITAYYRFDRVSAEVPALNTVAVARGAIVATVEATGTLEAVTTVQVGSQVSGIIKTLRADFNSVVRRGQVIAELDPSLFETQVEQAQATLARLEAERDRARIQAEDAAVKRQRARELFERQLIPANDLETAESTARIADAAIKAADAQLAQARASLNQARVNLSHTIIRSPIDGVVIARNVDAGQTVAASMQAPTLFVLARDLAQMRVNANVDESDIGRIESGQPVRFRVDAYPDETFTGTVSQVRLQPQVQQNVVSYVTIIDVPNPDLKLKPGMTAAVSIETARADDVLRVPNAALRFRPTDDVMAALGTERSGEDGGSSAADSGRAPRDVERATSGSADRERAPAAPSRRATVWTLDQGSLQAVTVRTGLTDGTQTAVLEAIRGELSAGTEVVTGVLTEATDDERSSSPLIPLRRGGRR
jgi:HlyD family secretion protein